MVKKSSYNPDPTPPEQQSRKSSESHTATFASRPDHKKKEEQKSQYGRPITEKKKDGPFQYDQNSEEDDYDSEQESLEYPPKPQQKNHDSSATPSKTHYTNKKDGRRQDGIATGQNSSRHSNDEDWIGGSGEKVPKSVRGIGHRGINDSSTSSQQLESMSTHTSPQFQAHPKLLKQKKLRKPGKSKGFKKTKQEEGHVSHNDFKQFLTDSKRQIISEKSSSKKKMKRCKSPLTIVDKLVDDAQRRLKNKQKYEHLGHGAAFAATYGQFNGTLTRDKSAQPRQLKRCISNSSYKSNDSSQMIR